MTRGRSTWATHLLSKRAQRSQAAESLHGSAADAHGPHQLVSLLDERHMAQLNARMLNTGEHLVSGASMALSWRGWSSLLGQRFSRVVTEIPVPPGSSGPGLNRRWERSQNTSRTGDVVPNISCRMHSILHAHGVTLWFEPCCCWFVIEPGRSATRYDG